MKLWLSLLALLSLASIRAADLNVLQLKTIPEGNYLVNLRLDGKEELLNLEVKKNNLLCVNTSARKLIGLRGQAQHIGNGVFMVALQNSEHSASQFWVFHEDGTASVKGIPDRGERQTAHPIQDSSLKKP